MAGRSTRRTSGDPRDFHHDRMMPLAGDPAIRKHGLLYRLVALALRPFRPRSANRHSIAARPAKLGPAPGPAPR